MEVKIWPRGPKEKGGYAMMPMRKNIPVGRDGWELTQCQAWDVNAGRHRCFQ